MRYGLTTEGQNLDFNSHFYFADIQILIAEPQHLTVKT